VRHDESLEIVLNSERLNLIRYAGGDTFLLPYLAKMIPPHTCYVEVFGGGAPLLLNKPPSKVEIYNDIDGDLVNLFRVVKERLDDFLKELEWVLVSRDTYYEYQYKLAKGIEKDPVRRAAMYFYVLRLSFGGKFSSGFAPSAKKNHAKDFFRAIEKLRDIHMRLRNVVIERLDFREVIRRYDSKTTFFYCDPPHLYTSTEAEKGKHYYQTSFTEKDYMDLLKALENIEGKFLLKQSVEIPWLREWAERNRFSVVQLKLKKSVRGRPRDESAEHQAIYFIANYKLKNL